MSGAPRRRERFEQFCTTVCTWLPTRVREVVVPTLIGFALINGFTFLVDLALVVALHGGLQLPLWLAVGGSYAAALALSFVLNRALNFRSHRPMRRQVRVYLVVVAVNYGGIVIGVTSGLAALGVAYPVARLAAGLLEAVFMYSSMRWLVFRDRPLIRR